MTDYTPFPLTIAPDEKSAQVMVYTSSSLYWGDVILKSVIRVSTWLRTNAVPDHISLYNARALYTGAGAVPRPLVYKELHIPVSQTLAFHLVPPASDPVDFDPTEPNRIMEPVSVLFGAYSVKGFLRISATSSIRKFLEVTRESFSALYDAEITCLSLPTMGAVSVPFILFRQETATFTKRP